MPEVGADALADLDAAAALDLVADLWRRAGWTVAFDAPRPQSVVATRSAAAGRDRVLVCVFAPEDGGRVGPQRVREAAQADGVDANCVTAVSTTGFTRDALGVADAYGVDAVGPEAVLRLADAVDAAGELGAFAD